MLTFASTRTANGFSPAKVSRQTPHDDGCWCQQGEQTPPTDHLPAPYGRLSDTPRILQIYAPPKNALHAVYSQVLRKSCCNYLSPFKGLRRNQQCTQFGPPGTMQPRQHQQRIRLSINYIHTSTQRSPAAQSTNCCLKSCAHKLCCRTTTAHPLLLLLVLNSSTQHVLNTQHTRHKKGS